MVRVRFAPSPTGYIHIGNTRIALFNWLFAMQNNGQFVLRYDDTDIERSRQNYVDGIAEDLQWLGIKPAEVHYQSKRFARYDAVAEELKAAGLLYPCYETPEELELRRKIRLSRKLPPVYGREALKLTVQEKQAFEAEGRKPHWRFLLPNFAENPFATKRTDVQWDDLVRGRQTIDLASMSDPVLIRADGTYLYTLPSVIDDVDMKISHIIRGDDHVTNTGVQIAIFAALKARIPIFGHINLLTTSSGEGLSKRTGALSIRSLREGGYEPMAVSSLAALIGTSENVSACPTMAELSQHFSLDAVSKSAAKFDPVDLLNLNRHLVHDMAFAAVAARLKVLGIDSVQAEPFWLAVHGNLEKVIDAAPWWHVVRDETLDFADLCADDKDFLRQAATLLPVEPWNHDTWQQWIAALKTVTERKGKALFKPFRVALTGRTSGPELADLLPLMGKALVEKRLAV
ncbi:MAG: Glutamate--tRNA ligase [Candidatus Tokpelaia hoelldobleri]|uniref:Glutamate--tRNA ligase n=1 Tax=Candidatus Tokpelaia hoelldobleri TaxID=1902579 RepID=A0A1U9JUD2_9HYPH|nr:MAG: Glutamate--tRNA ligase [Candidatus Tokpelaia hoelldoblerii]